MPGNTVAETPNLAQPLAVHTSHGWVGLSRLVRHWNIGELTRQAQAHTNTPIRSMSEKRDHRVAVRMGFVGGFTEQLAYAKKERADLLTDRPGTNTNMHHSCHQS